MTVGKVINFGDLGNNIRSLVEDCISIREIAYVPYSDFKVGAAVLTKNVSLCVRSGSMESSSQLYHCPLCLSMKAYFMDQILKKNYIHLAALCQGPKVESLQVFLGYEELAEVKKANLGNIYSGCNVENASYGLTICAERTALVKAVSSNEREITAVAVSGIFKGDFLPPCGACRQFIREFVVSMDTPIYLCFPDKSKILETSINELLPLSFNTFSM